MDKKKISTIVLICVLGIAGLIILYLIGFFDGSDNPTQSTDINSITTVSESISQKTEDSITNADTKTEETAKSEDTEVTEETEPVSTTEYKFRNQNLLNQHFEKHGKDMGFASAEEYEKAASAVVNDPDALHKIEAEDGDDIYYIEATNEFVVVSTDDYIRTYFLPDKGIDYFNKQ